MKDLCTTKKYDLSQLNDEQLQAVLDCLNKYDVCWEDVSITRFRRNSGGYNLHCNEKLTWHWIDKKECDKATNALELFEERLSNVKVDLKTPSDLTNEQRDCLMYMLKEEVYEEKAHNIYQRADQLMQDGKQHSLKIVVTFEKI